MTGNTILVGISGPSSSGKTTLSRLLRDVLNSSQTIHAFILHEDDFYKTDTEIPVNGDGLQDWDCLESINLPLLHTTLAHVKQKGALPPDFESKEDKNDVGKVDVDQDKLGAYKREIQQAGAKETTVAIIDGFLLYADSMADVRSLFDLRLFLRTSHETAKKRREARSGYVTLEGFWEDPPGYVDKVVWPNYVKDHAFLFENGNVESDYAQDVCSRLGILGMPRNAEGNMTKCFEWAYEHIFDTVKAHFGP